MEISPAIPAQPEVAWRKIPVFAGLSPATLDYLASKAQELNLQGGEAVVREGENGNKMFVICSGEVRVVKHLAAAHETVLATFKEGDFFGEMCILETLSRTATVVTNTPAHLWSLSSMAFYQLYREHPSEYSILLLNLARDLSRRLRRLDEAFCAKH